MPNFTWDEINDLRHMIANDRTKLHKIELHLRDYHRTSNDVQDNVVRSVIDEVLNFNCDNLGKTLDKLDEMIENKTKRKLVKQIIGIRGE